MRSLFYVITMDCWLSDSDFPYCSSHLQARQHYNGFYLLATARANGARVVQVQQPELCGTDRKGREWELTSNIWQRL